ncbi:serine palmitoyltransferase [Rhizosaccharibacter radicis]|uniref:Aminotransferase class I/II-fold pyridoxal phosphate-dependent enzyme n=1 Tax=Rhizosaccharibacter radicis TaxID=2782605 RepID=A0ABT1VW70_9PROT|nr:aminotransferase class I/II-fold pyridoxal phosphate-dependent enzyme [Acetobacteraceae bacterium KSS12]
MLKKYASLRDAFHQARGAMGNPFDVTFDAILSPTTARLGDRTVLLLGTNNYLGLTFDSACIADATEALRQEGTGTTGSRIANGTYGVHAALERRVARFLGRRDAMVFTTGYQANLGILSALAGREDTLLLDADSHASIYDGARLAGAQVTRFRHNDPADLDRRLRHLRDRPGEKLIVVEGLYSMLGDTAPLREIAAVKREHGAYLLVDEAHSLGVYGDHGRGLGEVAGVESDIDFVVGTFSKSLGAIGGFCASDLPDFELLRLTARAYMFTASLPPSVAAGVSRAFDRIDQQPELRQRLKLNAERLYHGLRAAGFVLGPVPSPIVSVRLSDPALAMRYWNELLTAGLYVNLALPPATPENQSLLRMSVSAAHEPEQIDRAVEIIAAIGTSLGVRSAMPDVAAAE